MADRLHSTHTNIYQWATWIFTDTADRETGSDYDISYDDIGKIGYQEDTRSYWRLDDVSSAGRVWSSITRLGGAGGGGYMEPVADGNVADPQIVFSEGDVVMTLVRDF